MARSVFILIIIASFLLPANRSFAGFRLNRAHQPATAYLQNNQPFPQNLLHMPLFLGNGQAAHPNRAFGTGTQKKYGVNQGSAGLLSV
jgi:hypothetical protein